MLLLFLSLTAHGWMRGIYLAVSTSSWVQRSSGCWPRLLTGRRVWHNAVHWKGESFGVFVRNQWYYTWGVFVFGRKILRMFRVLGLFLSHISWWKLFSCTPGSDKAEQARSVMVSIEAGSRARPAGARATAPIAGQLEEYCLYHCLYKLFWIEF